MSLNINKVYKLEIFKIILIFTRFYYESLVSLEIQKYTSNFFERSIKKISINKNFKSLSENITIK